MIQRIQTVYLLLVAVLMTVSVFCPLLSFKDNFIATGAGVFFEGNNQFPTWGVLTIGLLTSVLAFINIFLYKKRKVQVSVCYIITFLIAAFYATFYVYMNSGMQKNNWEMDSYQPCLVLPVVAFILNILAIIKIKKDEKLVRSLDRIR